ncbi:uncharacterized protein METZ01_LOCUS152643 [marine metagenome]|uniref:Amidohydrolase-related domain-containing protein n=1 Tax=marine metagenome TaxID=408172 RepID=A0A382AEF8_9ZZZZ
MDFVELDGAVDLHIHSFPCVFQRRIDDREAAQAASDRGMAAIVLKSHHESTVSRAYLLQPEFPDMKIFGGVVLNQFVGGINPAAAEVALRLGAKEVWMPTIDAAHHVEVHGVRGGYDVQTSDSEFVWGDPISAVKDGKVTNEALTVLELIGKYEAILGTAHLSLEEISLLVPAAHERGVKKILITHPYFRVPAGMNAEFLKEMIQYGAIAEFGYCTISPMWAYVNLQFTKDVMDDIGYDNCVVMSDTGQSHNPLPPEAVWLYAQGLSEKGVSPRNIEKLIKDTPKGLLSL